MNIVYITTQGSSVRRRGEKLEVFQREKKCSDIFLFDLERLVLVGSIQLTAPAIALLLERGIDVVFLSSRCRIRGTLVSNRSRNVFLRLAQYQCWHDARFRLAFSQQMIVAKLQGQLQVLERYRRNHPERLDSSAIEHLQKIVQQVPASRDLDELRGFEGTAAAIYYRQFGKMLPHMKFPGRKKRPSTDPVNALLSLGYVILTNEIISALDTEGLDPAVGFLHGLRYGRSSLALDVVEPFRQPVIDRLTLKLFNLRQFQVEDFEGGKEGVRLHQEAFKEYLGSYEKQLGSLSEGQGSPSWRERIRGQAKEVRGQILEHSRKPLCKDEGQFRQGTS